MNLSSITPYITTYVIPLEWWQKEIQERPDPLIHSAKVLIATAMVVTLVWGKLAALNVVITALLTYPYSHKQIQYFMYLDYETAQAVACIAIPILCSKIPLMSPWSIPLHIALGYSIWNRGVRLYQLSLKAAHENERLKQLNEELKRQVSSLQTNAQALEQELEKLLWQVSQSQELHQSKKELLQQEKEVVIQVDVDYQALNSRIETLTKLCATATRETGLIEQLSVINQYEQQIVQLANQCAAKNNELTKLIEEIRQLKETLNDILQQTQQKENQSVEGLQLINTYISSILQQQI